MYTIIGISGKIAAGKDTVVDEILLNYPNYEHLKFAYNVKHVVSILTGTTIEDNHSREGKAMIPPGFDKSLGTYQQIIGEGLRNLVGPNVWITPVIQHPAALKIISDVRYPNEVTEIEKAGGIVLRIHRPLKERLEALKGDTRNLEHESETALDNYPFKHVIENIGTIEELHAAVREIITTR